MIIHWSDWASQPTVRIACSQKFGVPWTIRRDLPPQVHEIPIEGEESTLYTYELHLVTCPKCLALDSFKEELKSRTEILTKAGWTFPPNCPEGVPPTKENHDK